MGRKCGVIGCKNRKDEIRDDGKSLFSLHHLKREVVVVLLKHLGFEESVVDKLPKKFNVCEDHFTPESFKRVGRNTRLIEHPVIVGHEVVESYSETLKSIIKVEAEELLTTRRVQSSHLTAEELKILKESTKPKRKVRCKITCDNCDYKTFNGANMERHKLTHGAKVECPVCSKQVSSLVLHMTTHKPKVSCPTCNRMMSQENMPKHMKNHMKNRKVLKCDKCDEDFTHKEELRRHIVREHYDGDFFECHCGAVYTSMYTLRKHQLYHNGEKLACGDCQKEFPTMRLLRGHCSRMQHVPPEKKRRRVPKKPTSLICETVVENDPSEGTILHKSSPFMCELCGLECFSESALEWHQQLHNETMGCRVCQKEFSNMRFLKAHYRKMHCPSEKKTRGLPKKPSTLICESLMDDDPVEDETTVSIPNNSNDSFICEDLKEGQTEETMRVSNKTSPIICDKCGSKFPNRKSFLVHSETHQSDAMFCDVCPRSFDTKPLLEEHMKGKHMQRYISKTECKVCHTLALKMYNHFKTHDRFKSSKGKEIYIKINLSSHVKGHGHSDHSYA